MKIRKISFVTIMATVGCLSAALLILSNIMFLVVALDGSYPLIYKEYLMTMMGISAVFVGSCLGYFYAKEFTM